MQDTRSTSQLKSWNGT